jgi:hypothetical protein
VFGGRRRVENSFLVEWQEEGKSNGDDRLDRRRYFL